MSDPALFKKLQAMISALPEADRRKLIDSLPEPQVLTPGDGSQLQIPQDILKQYADLQKTAQNPVRSASIDAEQRRWMRAVSQMNSLSVRTPAHYAQLSESSVYQRMKAVCAEKLLPTAMIEHILPSLMAFIRTGEMERPICFHGTAGCGKTSAAKIIIEDVLGIPAFVCAATDIYSRGLNGRSISWRGANYGTILDACLKSNSLNPGIIVDEIDKCVRSPNEPSVEDLLLSMCDDRREIEENFIGMTLPTRHMSIFFTANDIEKVSAPLLDRCLVYNYPDAPAEQIFEICKSHMHTLLEKGGYDDRISISDAVLREAVEALYPREHSIRQHKNLLERVIGKANIISLENQGRRLNVPITAFREVIDEMFPPRQRRLIGFC